MDETIHHGSYNIAKAEELQDDVMDLGDIHMDDHEWLKNFTANDPALNCELFDLYAALDQNSFDTDQTSSSETFSVLSESTPTVYCNRSWDTFLCWPKTPAGTFSVLPCFEEFNGIKYDVSQNATRLCQTDGTWSSYRNYTQCRDLSATGAIEASVEVTSTIYYVGYTLSLAALGFAVFIFLYFKDLRCLRNTIHTNLMLSYILADFMWILTITLQMSVQTEMASCVALVVLLHYCHLTNFFWMFVEGLYLHVLVVKTFTVENIKLRVYVCIGWGTPMLIVLVWALVKAFAPGSVIDAQSGGGGATVMVDIGHHCSWLTPHTYDWIYQAPAIAVLCINLVFLVMIMWVLITKLRSATSVETQQYRKATKALLVLIPLLGITYILMIAGPSEGVSAAIYAHVRGILLSTQGFTVSLFYCFMNSEVQNTLRHHWQRWQEARSINGVGGGRRYYNQSKDWSPKSRTESIRNRRGMNKLYGVSGSPTCNVHSLYSQPACEGHSKYRKRESCTSEVTMTTFVCNLNNGGVANPAATAGLPPRLSPGATNGSSSNNALLVRTSPRAGSGHSHDTSLNAPFLSHENAV